MIHTPLGFVEQPACAIAGSWAVHRGIGRDEDIYTITHVPSGLGVLGRGSRFSIEADRKQATAIAANLDACDFEGVRDILPAFHIIEACIAAGLEGERV